MAFSLEQTVDQIQDVLSLPQVAAQVLDVVNNPDSTGDDLKSVIEADPALAARVLRTANSPLFGSAREIRNVQHAVSMLGFNAIRNMAITVAVADVIKSSAETPSGFTRQNLWRHLVYVGVAGRLIAARFGLEEFEEAFLAGLMHDLGIALLDQHLPDQYAEIVRTVLAGKTLLQAEHDALGFDHTELGAAVAEKWKFPASMVAAMRYHHGAEKCTGEFRVLVQVVEVANFLCTAKRVCSVGNVAIGKPHPSTLEGLGLGRDEFRVLWEDFESEVVQAKSLIIL